MKPNTTPCPSLTTVATLPGRVDSSMLAKFRRADEPLIVLKLVGVGNSAPYDFHDKGTRSYIFRFESQMEGHILRVPLHLWQAGKGRLAHELMEQRRLPHAMVVLLESPPSAAKPEPLLSDTKMGATDTSTDARNVVGPGAEPTVAPSFALRASPSAKATEDTSEDRPATEGEKTVVDPSFAKATEGRPALVGEKTVAATSAPTETVPLIGGRPLHEAAYDLVEAPRRIKALAALLGVTEEVLRAGIAQADSRIELAHAGWVKRKA